MTGIDLTFVHFFDHLEAVVERKADEGKPTCADPVPDLDKLAALTEEFGEVARALQDEPEHLAYELFDLATAAVLWASAVSHEESEKERERA